MAHADEPRTTQGFSEGHPRGRQQRRRVAGQHDRYLNVVGPGRSSNTSVPAGHRSSPSAVTYRIRNGFDHRKVGMAVVTQIRVQAGGDVEILPG
jgi:phosphoenolpyruvate synthase/pyruvate phosphate dikinase